MALNTFDVSENASASVCFAFLCFRLLSTGGDGFAKVPFLVAAVRFSLEKKISRCPEQSSYSKQFREHILWINVVDSVKIHDIMYILCFSLILNRF